MTDITITDAIKQATNEITVVKYAHGCEVIERRIGELTARQLQTCNRVSEANKACRAYRAKRAAWLMTESEEAADKAGNLTEFFPLRDAVKQAVA